MPSRTRQPWDCAPLRQRNHRSHDGTRSISCWPIYNTPLSAEKPAYFSRSRITRLSPSPSVFLAVHRRGTAPIVSPPRSCGQVKCAKLQVARRSIGGTGAAFRSPRLRRTVVLDVPITRARKSRRDTLDAARAIRINSAKLRKRSVPESTGLSFSVSPFCRVIASR